MTVLSEAPVSPRRRATYADIEALPSNMVGEILAGELVASPRPVGKHAIAGSSLGGVVNVTFERGLGGPGGWWIVDEPELSLEVDPGFDPVVPDIAGWRIETMPEPYAAAQCHVVPDWICEIHSPSTRRRDRMLKMPYYARAGVRHLWLVDPLDETIEVYRLQGLEPDHGRWLLLTTAGGDQVARLEPFDAIELDLMPIWGRRREPSE